MNESEQQEIEKIKKECLTYFHQSPVWKKVLKGFRDKYSSYGRFGGKVVLKNLKVQDIEELDDEEWALIEKTIEKAVNELIGFRVQEGEMLKNLLVEKTANIRQLLQDVESYESERIEKVKSRIYDGLATLENKEYDTNRFEQEMIYYIEKLDVNEEKSRLTHHLDYFIETLNDQKSQGKKLGFIAQEMGREINTLGSKSNHSDIQRIVVQMKDELEQIKEQILNVL